jgi:hypothetical protein
MAGHIVLLGDSTIDNGAYTDGEPDVVGHLRALLPADWTHTLLAVDGSTIADVPRQLAGLPADTTHMVLSVGGNDALLNSDVLTARVSSTLEALRRIAERAVPFERSYRSLVDRVLALRRETILCTVYNGRLEGDWGVSARVALTTFNDAILRVAFEHGTKLIDLRLVCSEPADFANPIEPSGQGGRKIAATIAAAVLGAGRASPACVYTWKGLNPDRSRP